MPETPSSIVLLDTATNIDRGEWNMDDETKGIHLSQTILHGGKQEGSRLLHIDTGTLQMTLIPTRGMGIHTVYAGTVHLGWNSPIRDIVHPSFMNLESRNGLGWLEGFNEWLCRCGLEWSGHPGPDTFIDNVGNKASMNLSLHGKIANIPCHYAEVRIDQNRIIIHSRVEERVFHGPKLELQSEIIIEIGHTRFEIRDTVINHSGTPQEFQMFYHCNFGSPLLEKGARFVGAVETNDPFNDRAKEGLPMFDLFEEPQAGFIEQVYKMTLKSDAEKKTTVMLHNKAATASASMRFSTEELPCFTLWKNTDALEDGYVTGLEPGTSFPHNRNIERNNGHVPTLAPHASRTFSLDVCLHLSPDDVAKKKAEILAL